MFSPETALLVIIAIFIVVYKHTGTVQGVSYADEPNEPGELHRQELVHKLGLPQTADWGTIGAAMADPARQRRALELGLPESAGWGEISDEISRRARR